VCVAHRCDEKSKMASEGYLCSLERGKKKKKSHYDVFVHHFEHDDQISSGTPLHQWHQTKTRKEPSDPNWSRRPLIEKNKQNCESTHSMTDVGMFE